jgi:hypothetical protein
VSESLEPLNDGHPSLDRVFLNAFAQSIVYQSNPIAAALEKTRSSKWMYVFARPVMQANEINTKSAGLLPPIKRQALLSVALIADNEHRQSQQHTVVSILLLVRIIQMTASQFLQSTLDGASVSVTPIVCFRLTSFSLDLFVRVLYYCTVNLKGLSGTTEVSGLGSTRHRVW